MYFHIKRQITSKHVDKYTHINTIPLHGATVNMSWKLKGQNHDAVLYLVAEFIGPEKVCVCAQVNDLSAMVDLCNPLKGPFKDYNTRVLKAP